MSFVDIREISNSLCVIQGFLIKSKFRAFIAFFAVAATVSFPVFADPTEICKKLLVVQLGTRITEKDLLPQFPGELTRVQGARFVRAGKALEFQYMVYGDLLYVMDTEGNLSMAPITSPSGKLQTHRALIRFHLEKLPGRKIEEIVWLGAGELKIEYYNRQKADFLTELNNRSGTLKPSSQQLAASAALLRKKFPDTRMSKTKLTDFSLVGDKHPNYVKNEVLDVEHTIYYVEKFGKEGFIKAMSAADPKAALTELSRVFEAKNSTGPKKAIVPLPDLNDREWDEFFNVRAKPLGRARGVTPLKKAEFRTAFEEGRRKGLIFVDEEDFLRFYARSVRVDDKINQSVTALTVEIAVDTGQKKVKVPIKLMGSLLRSHSKSFALIDYHNDIIDEVTANILPEEAFLGDRSREGVVIRKKSGSSLLDIWWLSKTDYRGNGWDPWNPHLRYHIITEQVIR